MPVVGDSEKNTLVSYRYLAVYRFCKSELFKSKIGELGRPIMVFVFPLMFHVNFQGDSDRGSKTHQRRPGKKSTSKTCVSHLVASWWEKCN